MYVTSHARVPKLPIVVNNDETRQQQWNVYLKSGYLSFEINHSNLALPLVIPTPLSRNRFKQAGS